MKGLTIKQNKNFTKVILYEQPVLIEQILKEKKTRHFNEERNKRFDISISLNETNVGQAEIDKVFVVDKGHIDGEELHCVSKNGIIFILNKRKYEKHINSFITILIARPNQIKRLYDECNLKVDKDIMNCAKEHINMGYNMV